jgi:3-isopropylmalate/(R)-2-methylmalate dehydratase small subunit
VDLEHQVVVAPPVGDLAGVDVGFEIDQHTKHCLLNGLDDVAQTLQHADAIAAYEATRAPWKPLVPTA